MTKSLKLGMTWLTVIMLLSLLAACGAETVSPNPSPAAAPTSAATSTATILTTAAATTIANVTTAATTIANVTAAPAAISAATTATTATAFATTTAAVRATTVANTTTVVNSPTAVSSPANTIAAPRTTGAVSTAPISTQAGGGQASGARYQDGQCPFTLPKGQTVGQTARCGFVTVPELHAQPGGKTIQLAVVIFKSTNPNPAPEPIVYLEGGPGGHVQSIIDLMTGDFYQAFTAKNDAIFFDQRGVGASKPALVCTELIEQSIQDAPLILSPQDANNHQVEAATKCHDRLVGQGINLSAYNTIENAADVNDIRAALGYQKINLYGGSYGTLLAQTVMRLFPQILRSVILDSVVPPDLNPDINSIATGSRSFNLVFGACAADAACNRAFPDLKNVFSKTFTKLNQNPPTVKVTDPQTNKTFDAKADGSSFVSTLFILLYSTDVLGIIPQLIYTIYQGNYTILGTLLGALLEEQEGDDAGMYYSVECSETWPYSQPSDAEAPAKAALPELAKDNDIAVQATFSLCQKWNVAKLDPAQHAPVVSDLPTLVMEGQFDPITPPEYGQRVAKNLSHSFYVEFPASGHGEVIPGATCGLSVMTQFIADPNTKPDSSCTSQLTLKFRTN